MSEKLFDTSLKTYKERKTNVEKELSTEFFEEINRDDIKKNRTMMEGYSGWFSDRIAQYLVHSHDVETPKGADYPFYASDNDYYRTGIAKAILLTDNIGSWTDDISSREYEIQEKANKDAYLRRLFDEKNLNPNILRNFIKMGLHKDLRRLDMEEYSFILLRGLQKLQKIVWKGCKKESDKVLLKYFDGKRSIEEIASIYGVSRQNISKKITKICKNAIKRLHTEKGCAGFSGEVDNQKSA
ncbi:hypothetical protein [Limosilactobacillus reuteri]|uniref:Sigma-70 family RNA polymerase sigma factor n=1 Tax=Limosilactobacillus reuteri TaxID=1598 RepID=A0AAX2SST7_LIMRT|nr:hypothetical protein [Limosilactobacillus reuteri]TGB09669.1 hypothetical protein E5F87_09775 [Limosilactobacillus reuteri]